MPTADQLTARIETLKVARDSGVLTVKHGETQTTFRSLSEIRSAISAAEDELFRLTNGTPVRQFQINSRKGL